MGEEDTTKEPKTLRDEPTKINAVRGKFRDQFKTGFCVLTGYCFRKADERLRAGEPKRSSDTASVDFASPEGGDLLK